MNYFSKKYQIYATKTLFFIFSLFLISSAQASVNSSVNSSADEFNLFAEVVNEKIDELHYFNVVVLNDKVDLENYFDGVVKLENCQFSNISKTEVLADFSNFVNLIDEDLIELPEAVEPHVRKAQILLGQALRDGGFQRCELSGRFYGEYEVKIYLSKTQAFYMEFAEYEEYR